MKALLRLMTLLLALSLSTSMLARAQETGKPAKADKADKPAKVEGGEKPKREMPPMEDLTLAGTVSKEEKEAKKKNKEGVEETVKHVLYQLTTATGEKIALPQDRQGGKGKDAAKPINLDDFVGKQVKIVGKGMTKVGKDKAGVETKSVMLKQITSIEIVLAP